MADGVVLRKKQFTFSRMEIEGEELRGKMG